MDECNSTVGYVQLSATEKPGLPCADYQEKTENRWKRMACTHVPDYIMCVLVIFLPLTLLYLLLHFKKGVAFRC